MNTPDEALAPERETEPRRYTVVITEHAECVVHQQLWTEIRKDEAGRAVMGYMTLAKREKRERELFRGEFTKRPNLVALAQLMEDTP